MTEKHHTTSRFRLSRGEMGVAAFNLLYMIIALFATIQRSNTEFIFYLVVMCVLMAAVFALHVRVQLPIAVLWGLSVWGAAHMAGGLMPVPETWPTHGNGSVLYNLWIVPERLKFDQVVHAYGFGLVTWVCWLGLRKAFAAHGVSVAPTVGLLTLCVAGGMGFGAANEVVEFLATITLPDTNVGGYENTGWDLVANTVGCVLVALVIYVWPTHRGASQGSTAD